MTLSPKPSLTQGSTMPSLDTNVLLRLILRDNEAMVATVMQLLKRHEEFAVADIALTEVEYILTGYYQYDREAVADVFENLANNQHLNINRVLLLRVLPKYVKCPAVSFDDLCLEAYAYLNKQTPLYTFDKKLARQLPHTELVD